MKRIALITVLSLLAVPSAYAQDWAKQKLEKSPRHLEWKSVMHDKREVKCFVAYPQRKEKAAVVLLIHEIFGLSDWIRDMADQLAEAGYIVVAPDLLTGMGPSHGDTASFAGQDDVRKAISSLPQSQIDDDMAAAEKYALTIPSANGELAVAGFCWGGSQVYKFANSPSGKTLKDAFVFYGTPPESASGLANIQCPVYGFYGENDARVTSTVPSIEAEMKKAGKTFEAKIYPGAGHGFMRSGEAPGAKEADKAARAEAWKRLLEKLNGLNQNSTK